MTRKGEEEVERTFTIEDAKKAGLYGKQGPWQTAPRRMMQMRARAFALRDVFTDVLRGVHIAEIAQDEPAEKDITAESSEVKAPASRADKARAAIADRRKETVHVPAASVADLAEVVAAIQQAETPEAMSAAAKLSEHLSDDDKKSARKEYKARLETLKQQQAAADEAEKQDHSVDLDDDFLRGLEAGSAA